MIKEVQNSETDQVDSGYYGLDSYITNYFEDIPSAEEALNISKEFKIPLHPAYTDYWGNLKIEKITQLREFLVKNFKNDNLMLKIDPEIKNILEQAFVPHEIKENRIVFSKAKNEIFEELFSLRSKKSKKGQYSSVFEYFDEISPIKIKASS